MLSSCHSSINLPLPLNAARRLCLPQGTVTHRGDGTSAGVTVKKIPLVNSRRFALVDDGDWGMLSQFRWSLIHPKPGAEYAETYIGYCSVRMHNLILPSARMVDHRDRNGLNNRRSNLRQCNHCQNRANSIKQHSLSTSRYKGVCWNKAAKMWKAHIGSNGQRVFLGYFKRERDAAKAYNEAAKKKFKQFARLNKV